MMAKLVVVFKVVHLIRCIIILTFYKLTSVLTTTSMHLEYYHSCLKGRICFFYFDIEMLNTFVYLFYVNMQIFLNILLL